MNPDLAAKIKAWNKADVKLYDHFNKTFWKRVEAFGMDKMNQELEQFRIEAKKAEEECIDSYQVILYSYQSNTILYSIYTNKL